MAQITFTIENEKLPRIVNAMKGLYPIPQINTGTEDEPVWVNEFTDNQWAKESVRRWIRNQVARWEQKTEQEAIPYVPENDIIT